MHVYAYYDKNYILQIIMLRYLIIIIINICKRIQKEYNIIILSFHYLFNKILFYLQLILYKKFNIFVSAVLRSLL